MVNNFVNNKANGDIVLDTLEFFHFLCFSLGSVATHCRCGEKYDMDLVAYLTLSLTVKEFLKSDNTSQSYERISSGTFFMVHGK